jgi:hypothetical protein
VQLFMPTGDQEQHKFSLCRTTNSWVIKSTTIMSRTVTMRIESATAIRFCYNYTVSTIWYYFTKAMTFLWVAKTDKMKHLFKGKGCYDRSFICRMYCRLGFIILQINIIYCSHYTTTVRPKINHLDISISY